MPWTFTWLDTSEHDRQKALEIINLFSEKDVTGWDRMSLSISMPGSRTRDAREAGTL